MKEFIYVFIGGGIGSALRYLIRILIDERGIVHEFPFATFIVNMLGCFLIGLFYSLSSRFHLSMEVRLFLIVGICGGFTTFSTFSHEAMSLLKGGLYGTFFLYTLLSMALGILAVILGIFISK